MCLLFEHRAVLESEKLAIGVHRGERSLFEDYGEWLAYTKHQDKISLPPKSENEFRIFAYGGSTVNGAPSVQLCFLEQVKFYLEELIPDLEIKIFNFGAGGRPSSAVRRDFEHTIDNRCDAVIILSGHNEFLNPGSEPHALLISLMGEFAFIRILDYILAPKVREMSGMISTRLSNEGIAEHDSLMFEKKIDRYRNNIMEIAGTARGKKIPLFLCTAPSNLLWPPCFKRDNKVDIASFDTVANQCLELIHEKKISEASEILETLEVFHRTDPMVMFLRGMILFHKGDSEEAYANLLAAKDRDPYPSRALSIFNSIIREASTREDVHLVDAEAEVREHTGDGITDYEYIADNCHPTPLGGSIIAGGIVRSLLGNNLIGQDIEQKPECCRFDKFLSFAGFYDPDNTVRSEYLLSVANYCIDKSNYPAARNYLVQAEEIDSANWRIWLDIASVSFFEGKMDDGFEQLRKAESLSEKSIFPIELEDAPFLEIALASADVSFREVEERLARN